MPGAEPTECVDAYVASLPDDRREAFDAVLELVRENLPPGYEEAMNWGMVCWQVPLDVYPDTYNKQPLMFCGLANRKNHLSLYFMPAYVLPDGLARLKGSGKKLKMGKSCINFTTADELPLTELGDIIRDTDVDSFVTTAKAARDR